MLFTKLKKKEILIFIVFIFLLSDCAIKDRLKEKPIKTFVEKPPELLLQDANRYMQNQNFLAAAKGVFAFTIISLSSSSSKSSIYF